ncbi:hypothetical protein [Glycomyces paridis]|uniref:Uncharacterized protein n=1 Tax=Glycomyces paridis TaxID=2126555 RepID=A0A4S8PGK0_9ACTN|nr:hypothetical protein [Glycomyces paridis]THV29041.1 hypothetical protein E9998_09865 [Glycomyces paridis]
MRNQAAQAKSAKAPADPLERGGFGDGRDRFTVCASSLVAPDSFQVYANGNRADLVLIVSGLTTGSLHATWGDGWREALLEWKRRFQEHAFDAFYNGPAPAPAPAAPAKAAALAVPGVGSTASPAPVRHRGEDTVRFCRG